MESVMRAFLVGNGSNGDAVSARDDYPNAAATAEIGRAVDADEIRRALDEIDRLRELVRDFGRHSEGCSAEFGPTYRCRCGWRDVEAEFATCPCDGTKP